MRDIVITLDQLRRRSPGGIGTYIRGLISGLSELVEHGELDGRLIGVIPQGRTDLGVEKSRLELRTVRVPEKLTTRLWATGSLGIPRSADVVHATSMAGPFRGGRNAAVHSVLVHDVLWRAHRELATARGARFHEARLQRIIRRDDVRVLVTSPRLVDELSDSGISRERLFVVRLGVRHWTVPVDRARVLADPRLSGLIGPDGNYTVAVGTIQPRKNIERLIVAHARARAVAPSLGPLLLVGSRGWGEVDTSGAHELGSLDDHAVRALVHCARVSAFVALDEGWGLPPVESLAEGRPTVAANTVPSVVHNVEAIKVDPLDVDSICDGLVTAVQSADDDAARERRRASVRLLNWSTCAADHVVAWS